jgi:hypothetical protein
VEGKLQPFLEELQKERFRCQGDGQEIKIKPPEGENSKKIRAIAKKTGTTIVRLIPPGADANFYNGFLKWQSIYLFLLLIVVGGGLIAKDAKFNALQIYLAKPITGMEYVLGKLGIVVFFLTMVTLVPGLLQFVFQAILIGDSLYFRHYWWVPAAICGYSLLTVFSGSLLVLAFSALSRNDRSASFGVAAVFLFSPVIARLLSETGNPAYSLLSFRHNWTRLGQEMFGLKEKVGGWRSLPDVWWGWSLLVLVAIMVLCAVVLLRRVRGLEVVK